MHLPPFVLIEHPTELKDKTLILQTSPPYCIGEVLRFDTAEKATSFEDRQRGTVWINYPSYRIYITHVGFLINNQPVLREIESALIGMKQFYYDARILLNASRFNRYKID